MSCSSQPSWCRRSSWAGWIRGFADCDDLLAREQELVRREAVRDERDRIARELHDVIAHSVSAIVVQVAATQDLVQRNPGGTADIAREQVADTGRRAIVQDRTAVARDP